MNLAFQGGEPTLAGKTFFRTLLELEKQLNTRKIQVHHSLQTNGYSLDQEWMDIFREGHFLIGVSLDGTKEIHDTYRIDAAYQPTYDHIQKNIKLLQESGIEYNILCVVHQSVAEKPREVFQALQK
ncbi:Anaerobic sulfatase-maturating enzyme [bioreactor metagenome]|uniref:Anaerobic sulfatase-maturating enzyme n=1 Tax=bioreactor metagenome TaxID=1076179 RepID=A0A645H0V9_9ZZZZ